MRAATGSGRTLPRTWSWPAFLGAFTWFFYRKMYVYGALVIFLPVVLSYLLGAAGGSGPSVLFAMWAKGWYVNSALGRIAKADRLGLSGDERFDYLQRAGGVSWPAGIFAGLIYACGLALVIFAAFAKKHAGH
jgi:hypothetical protein